MHRNLKPYEKCMHIVIFHGGNPSISIRFSNEPETLKEKIAKQHPVMGEMVFSFIESRVLNCFSLW